MEHMQFGNMKLVKEYIEFEKGKDPKRSMGIGKFYEIWRDEHMNEPILSVYYRLKDQNLKEYVYVVDLMYGQEESWGPKSTGEMRDAVWFEEGLYKAKGNRFRKDPIASKSDWQWFPTEEEPTSWDHSEAFNKQIIDKLEKNPQKVFDELVKDWFDSTPDEVADSLVRSLEDQFKRGFILEDINYEYHP
jgi:hypothetical protein